MPIHSLIYIPRFVSQSKEYPELFCLFHSRANTSCNWTHLQWPRWPLVHLTTFGDRWPQCWMQMTANNYKSPAMHSATCNKICSYIRCPLIMMETRLTIFYTLPRPLQAPSCQGTFRQKWCQLKSSHNLLHSHFFIFVFQCKKNHEICFLKRQRQLDSSYLTKALFGS